MNSNDDRCADRENRWSLAALYGILHGLMRKAVFVLLLVGCSNSNSAAGVADAGLGPTDAAKDTNIARDDVRFIAVGDTGKGNAGQKQVANSMAETCSKRGCDFVTLLGDNIYESGISSVEDPQLASKFEDIYAAIDVDFQMVLGNHDYGGAGLGTEFDKSLLNVAYTNKSKKWKLPAPHYRFSKKFADFFALDTNLMMFDKDADEKAIVPTWLAESKAPWKIALGHHPYKSNGPHGNAGTYDGLTSGTPYSGTGVQTFLESIVCGKVDLYISGHDHSMQWLNESCQGTALAVSGAGASPSSLGGKNAVAFESTSLGFLYVTATQNTLTAEFVDEKGATLHTETLHK